MRRAVNKIKGRQRPMKFDPLVPAVPTIIADSISFVHKHGTSIVARSVP